MNAGLAQVVGARRGEEVDLSSCVPEALVYVAARTGQVGVPFRHECDRQVVASADLLECRLEQRGLVRRGQHVVIAERRFPYAGARLGVDPLDVDVVRLAGIQDVVDQDLVLACAQP